jgi:hypothetical protein
MTMKRILLASLLSALASVSLAHDDALGDIGELYGSPILDHRATAGGEPLKGEGELYGSFFANPETLKADPDAKVVPWRFEDDWKSQIN